MYYQCIIKKKEIFLRFLITTILLLNFTLNSYTARNKISSIFNKIELQIDTNSFIWPEDTIHINNIPHLFFSYDQESEICQVNLFSKNHNIKNIELVSTNDFRVMDTLIPLNDSIYQFKAQFNDITTNDFIKFTFLINKMQDTTPSFYQLNLLPYTKTEVQLRPLDNELYIGEEKIFEVVTNNLQNIITNGTWTSGKVIDYRLSKTFNQFRLHLIPNKLGEHTIKIPLKTRKPFINKETKEVSYNLQPLSHTFQVKKGRLKFLNINKKDIILNETSSYKGIEIQIDNSRLLKLEKTYRIEDQEEPGGPLIAEIYTRNNLANNKVLCWLRVFNYHQKSEGYLYIKDGDKPKFITNFNIIPATEIEEINILRPGKDWTSSHNVYPGETIFLRIQGKSLNHTKMRFEDVEYVLSDSLANNDKICEYKIHIPLDISKKKINLYMNSRASSHFLNVKEYRIPRDFDYVYLNYGATQRFSGIRGPLIFYPTIKDVVISFRDFLIDSRDELYGKQYLSFDITVTNKNGKLVEMQELNNVVICPSEKSPRYKYYDKDDCDKTSISLNNHLRNKTYNLPEWSRIRIKAKHDKQKYNRPSDSKEVEIVQGKKVKFDVEVSFPGGLITLYKQDKDNDGTQEMDYGKLGGISLAMIAQLSFYNPNKIAEYRPYKIGVGSIALNALNFSENADNDLGLVVLGSVYPTTKDVKLTFPLYFGGGYLIKKDRLFLLIGPGIRVSL